MKKHSPQVTLQWVQAEAFFTDKAKDVDRIEQLQCSWSRILQIFVQAARVFAYQISAWSQFFYYRVLHNMIYTSHGIGNSSKWIMDIVWEVLHFL